MNKPHALQGKFTAYWYEYPRRSNNSFGAGGWSRGASSRPRPVLKSTSPKRIVIKGKSAYLTLEDGEEVRKLKVTIVRNTNGEVVRNDYDLDRIINDSLPSPLCMVGEIGKL